MATNYPIALDTNTNLPNPTGTSFQNNPDHGQQHANANDAIKALETKLGIGNTAPSATGLLLVPTGPGTTAWSQLTSSQLAATLTDETGTGNAVFNTTPTLVTPKVDTINENTSGNGVTVGGVNMKAGAITTANAVSNGAVAPGVQTSKLSNPYKFSAYRTAAQSIIASGWTKVNFETKIFDTGSNYDSTTNFRFIAPVAGFYQFNGAASVVTTAASDHIGSLYKNGSEFHRGSRSGYTGGSYTGNVSGLIQLAVGDYIEFYMYNGTSGAKALEVGGPVQCYFNGYLVSTT